MEIRMLSFIRRRTVIYVATFSSIDHRELLHLMNFFISWPDRFFFEV